MLELSDSWKLNLKHRITQFLKIFLLQWNEGARFPALPNKWRLSQQKLSVAENKGLALWSGSLKYQCQIK